MKKASHIPKARSGVAYSKSLDHAVPAYRANGDVGSNDNRRGKKATGQAGIRYISEDLIKKVSRADSLDVITTLNLTLAREGGKKIKYIENLDKLRKLQVLNLSCNMIEKMEKLEKLTRLQELNLAFNSISKIEGLESLVNLQVLNLNGNLLEHIPVWLGKKLKALRVLRIARNQLASLNELSKLRPLQDLVQLNVSENPLSQLPHAHLYLIFHLRTLEVLDGQAVEEQERLDAHDRFHQDEIEHLERQLEKNEQRLHRLEDDHNKSISEVKVREQREKEFKKREKLAAEKLRNTERELETKDDLLKMKTAELSRACEKHYQLEQELAFFKIDAKFETLGKIPPPPQNGGMELDDSGLIGESPYVGRSRFKQNRFAYETTEGARGQPIRMQQVPQVNNQSHGGQPIKGQMGGAQSIRERGLDKEVRDRLQEALDKQLNDKQKAIERAQDKLRHLQEDLSEKENQVLHATQELLRIAQATPLRPLTEDDKQKLRNSLTRKMVAVNELREEANRKEGEVASTQNEVERRQSEMGRLHQRLKGMDGMDMQYSAVEAEMADQEVQLTSSSKALEDLERDLELMMDRIARETHDIHKLEQQLKEGQAAQNDELKSELEGIIAGLQGYLSDIKGQQERQRRAYDELLLERDVLQEKLDDMEAEMSVLDAEGGDTRSMAKRIKDLESTLHEQSHLNSTLQHQLDQTSPGDAEEKIRAAEAEVQLLRQQLANAHNTAEAEKERLKKKLDAERQQLQMAEAKKAQQAGDEGREAAHMMAQLAALQATNVSLRQRLEDQEEELREKADTSIHPDELAKRLHNILHRVNTGKGNLEPCAEDDVVAMALQDLQQGILGKEKEHGKGINKAKQTQEKLESEVQALRHRLAKAEDYYKNTAQEVLNAKLSAEKKHHESEKQQMQKDIEQLKRALNDLHNQPRESNNQRAHGASENRGVFPDHLLQPTPRSQWGSEPAPSDRWAGTESASVAPSMFSPQNKKKQELYDSMNSEEQALFSQLSQELAALRQQMLANEEQAQKKVTDAANQIVHLQNELKRKHREPVPAEERRETQHQSREPVRDPRTNEELARLAAELERKEHDHSMEREHWRRQMQEMRDREPQQPRAQEPAVQYQDPRLHHVAEDLGRAQDEIEHLQGLLQHREQAIQDGMAETNRSHHTIAAQQEDLDELHEALEHQQAEISHLNSLLNRLTGQNAAGQDYDNELQRLRQKTAAVRDTMAHYSPMMQRLRSPAYHRDPNRQSEHQRNYFVPPQNGNPFGTDHVSNPAPRTTNGHGYPEQRGGHGHPTGHPQQGGYIHTNSVPPVGGHPQAGYPQGHGAPGGGGGGGGGGGWGPPGGYGPPNNRGGGAPHSSYAPVYQPPPQVAGPVHHQVAAPVHHQVAAPVQSQMAAPVHHQVAAPVHHQVAAPVQLVAAPLQMAPPNAIQVAAPVPSVSFLSPIKPVGTHMQVMDGSYIAPASRQGNSTPLRGILKRSSSRKVGGELEEEDEGEKMLCNVPEHHELEDLVNKLQSKIKRLKEQLKEERDNPTVVEYKKGKSTKSMNGLLNTLKDQLEDRRDQLEALDLDVGRQKARLEAMQMTEKELKKSQRLALGELKDLQRDNDMRALRKELEDSMVKRDYHVRSEPPETESDSTSDRRRRGGRSRSQGGRSRSRGGREDSESEESGGGERRLNYLDEELACMEETLDKRRAELREADRLLQECLTDLKEAREQAKDTISRYDEARSGLAVAEQDAAEIEKRSTEAGEALVRAGSEITSLHSQITQLETKRKQQEQLVKNINKILSVRDSEYRAVEVKTRALEQRCGEAQEAMTALEEKDKERVEVLRNSELVLAQRTANLEQLNQQIESNKAELQDLDGQLGALRTSLEMLEKEKDTRQQEYNSLMEETESELVKRQTELKATQEYLLDLEDKNRDLDLALKDKGEQLEDTKEDIVSAERDLKELKSETTKQKQDLKHTLEMLQLEQSEMENMATQHQQKLQELENIRTDLQEEKSELERLVSESSCQDTELKQLRLAADRERRGLEELRTEHAALETSIAVMTKDHSQLQHTSTNMDDKLKQIKKSYADVEDALYSAKSELEGLQSELHLTEGEVTAARKEKSALNRDVQAIRQTVQEGSTELKNLKEELNIAEEQLDQVEKACQAANAKKEEILAEVERLNTNFQQTRNENGEKESHLRQMMQDIEQHNRKYLQVKNDLTRISQEAGKEKMRLDQMLHRAQVDLDELRSEKSQKLEELESVSTGVDSLKAELRDLQHTEERFSELEQRVRQMEGDVQHHQEEKTRLAETLNHSYEELQALRDTAIKDKEAAVEEIQQLQSEVSDLQQHLQETNKQMRHLRRKCGKEMQRVEQVAEEHCNRANRISEELNQMRADYMEVKRELMSQGQMKVKEQKMEESMLLIRKDIQEEVSRGLQELDKSRIDRDEELDKLYQQKDHLENGLEKLQKNLITLHRVDAKNERQKEKTPENRRDREKKEALREQIAQEQESLRLQLQQQLNRHAEAIHTDRINSEGTLDGLRSKLNNLQQVLTSSDSSEVKVIKKLTRSRSTEGRIDSPIRQAQEKPLSTQDLVSSASPPSSPRGRRFTANRHRSRSKSSERQLIPEKGPISSYVEDGLSTSSHERIQQFMDSIHKLRTEHLADIERATNSLRAKKTYGVQEKQ